MEKTIVLLLAIMLVISMAVTVFAVESQNGTTTLTANVPDAAYTIQIPADMELTFGISEPQEIGTLTVSDCSHFRNGEAIYCLIEFTDLKFSDFVIPVKYTYVIPERDNIEGELEATSESDRIYMLYKKDDSGNSEYFSMILYANVSESDWEKAGYGQYTATMNFEFWVP